MKSGAGTRTCAAIVAAIALSLAAPGDAFAASAAKTGYLPVHGLEMYYEVHGTGSPLVLLHGAFSATGTSFEKLLPELAKTRQVISLEMQGHGHTADIDRPLTYEQMADDTAAALQKLGIQQADFFGYSMGAEIALQVAKRHPDRVRKLVLAAAWYRADGLQPGLLESMKTLKPEDMAESPWQKEYIRIAPHPANFPALVAKIKKIELGFKDWPAEDVKAIKAPTLLIVGDSDAIRLEHAVAMFRLLGGGVFGDKAGLPNSQLAILPGTTHTTLVSRADLLLPIIPPFLEAPMPKAK